ncbi:uncharacterized protein PAC_03099 [Phialocephala subalpina]|uniref:Uncharacterized protein n=1 Tax=Phialocephala subalpina TaxID=576137 RepID=A0A1L7WKC5_9HELO|nr:uncharacterized protein PAC_03099 [Phialocephala subalpina]
MYKSLSLFHTHGFTTLGNSIPEANLTKLKPKMYAEAEAKGLDSRDFHPRHGSDQLLVAASTGEDFLFKSVRANKPAVAVLEHLNGPNPQIRLYQCCSSIGRY